MIINQHKLQRQEQGVAKVIDNFKQRIGATLEWCN